MMGQNNVFKKGSGCYTCNIERKRIEADVWRRVARMIDKKYKEALVRHSDPGAGTFLKNGLNNMLSWVIYELELSEKHKEIVQ